MVAAISTSTTEVCKVAYIVASNLITPGSNDSTQPLECISCIHYPVWFKKDQAKVQALLDSGNEVNAMTTAYAARLGLKVRPNDVGAQKIDGSTLEIF